MNERFNELRLDAGISRLHNEPYLVVINKSGEIIDPLIGLEKFAELIVRECVKCCDDLERTNQHYISKFGIDPDIRPKQCIEVIKQHFGVKE